MVQKLPVFFKILVLKALRKYGGCKTLFISKMRIYMNKTDILRYSDKI